MEWHATTGASISGYPAIAVLGGQQMLDRIP